MTTTQRATRRTSKPPATSQPTPDPMRRAATIVGWLFIVTYVTSISAKIGFYPPLFDGNYITGPGDDTRVLWGAFAECILLVANIGSTSFKYQLFQGDVSVAKAVWNGSDSPVRIVLTMALPSGNAVCSSAMFH